MTDQLEFEWVEEAGPRAEDGEVRGTVLGAEEGGRVSGGNGRVRRGGASGGERSGQAESSGEATHAERQARLGRSSRSSGGDGGCPEEAGKRQARSGRSGQPGGGDGGCSREGSEGQGGSERPSQSGDEDGRRSEEARKRAEVINAKAERLWKALQERTGLPIHLTLTNNSSSLMSMRHVGNGALVKLRLHHMFLDADARVVRALGTWVKQPKRKSSGEVLNEYIREHLHLVREKAPRQDRLRTKGRHHNLRELFDEVNGEHFSGQITARIGWGRASTVRRQRSIRFGSYWAGDNLIRIHPALDQACVPRYFVRYIVFHEMLHAFLGIEETPTGRRRVHTKAFREAEEAYPEYERAVAWQNKPANMKRVMR